jgi:tripartite-type tricarboxylate transporter receptor subunit TctC
MSVSNDSVNRRTRTRVRLIGGLAASALGSIQFPGIVRAQADRPLVRILVGFPPGGTIDSVARVLADQIKDDLGSNVVVESKPGAGGQLAAQALKAAPADGRTLLLSPDHTMVMVPLTIKAPGFQSQTDFAAICPVARYPGGFAVSTQVPARNLSEFFSWARNNAPRASVGVPAPGSIPQFLVHRLAQQSQSALAAIPYRGSAPLLQDLMGGQIAAGTTALGDFVEPHLAGRLRVIAVLAPQRSSALPEVPTFAEQGFRIDWEFWLGLFAPAQTPVPEKERIRAAVTRALGRPEMRERMQKIVFEPAPGKAADLDELVRAGKALWEPIVRSSDWVPQ